MTSYGLTQASGSKNSDKAREHWSYEPNWSFFQVRFSTNPLSDSSCWQTIFFPPQNICGDCTNFQAFQTPGVVKGEKGDQGMPGAPGIENCARVSSQSASPLKFPRKGLNRLQVRLAILQSWDTALLLWQIYVSWFMVYAKKQTIKKPLQTSNYFLLFWVGQWESDLSFIMVNLKPTPLPQYTNVIKFPQRAPWDPDKCLTFSKIMASGGKTQNKPAEGNWKPF